MYRMELDDVGAEDNDEGGCSTEAGSSAHRARLAEDFLNSVSDQLNTASASTATNSVDDHLADSEDVFMDTKSSPSSTRTTESDVELICARSAFMASIDRLRAHVEFESPQHSSKMVHTLTDRDLDFYRTTPIFSSSVASFLDSSRSMSSTTPFEQYGLIGLQNNTAHDIDDASLSARTEHHTGGNMLLANMNVPSSTFICGSQGAGKSHTLSCLLENALLTDSSLGQLPNPLAALVFHYDTYTSAFCTQLCEAAYLCSSGIPVNVLVSPSNIWAMTELYKQLPGLPHDAPRPKVLPLYLSESQLDISTMLKLMSVDTSADRVPLYMETVMTILREMAMEGRGAGSFSYKEFRARLDQMVFTKDQMGPLSLRLQLLDAFLEPSEFSQTTRPARAKEDIWNFRPGTLTIVDLSDPFVNSDDACALFSICLSLFLSDRAKCGRVVALDEAHKFLTQSGEARVLTNNLTSVIRQQRHTGTRVIIATQEPTLSPELIDLCNATFVHRFNSPAWYKVLEGHLAGANKQIHEKSGRSLFETIAIMETGEALLFCPTALINLDSTVDGGLRVAPLGNHYARIKIRNRLTIDGGRSILASETMNSSIPIRTQHIEMHVVARPVPSSFGNRRYRQVAPVQQKFDIKSQGPRLEEQRPRSREQRSTPEQQRSSREEQRSRSEGEISSSEEQGVQSTVTLNTRSTLAAINSTNTNRSVLPAPPPRPLGKIQLPLTQKMKMDIENHTRLAVRANIGRFHWRAEKDVVWENLINQVEHAIGARLQGPSERVCGLRLLRGITKDELYRHAHTKGFQK